MANCEIGNGGGTSFEESFVLRILGIDPAGYLRVIALCRPAQLAPVCHGGGLLGVVSISGMDIDLRHIRFDANPVPFPG